MPHTTGSGKFGLNDNTTAGALAGKVALVTGSSRNIGRETALRLAADGAAIVVNAVQDRDAAEAVAEEIRAMGGQALVCMADVTDESAVAEMAEAAKATFGGIDILVSNASVRQQQPLHEMPLADWQRVVRVVLDGAFLCTRACIPHMMASGWGRIITLGGISFYSGIANRSHLLAAKAGLVGLTRGLAVELGQHSITANVVSPGHIDTLRPASAGARPKRDAVAPIPRMGKTSEVAGMIHYLCLPEADFITGQTMHVNGGEFLGY